MDIFGFQKKINQTVDVIGNIFLERPPLLYFGYKRATARSNHNRTAGVT
jgi:hypothetical protein